METAGDWEGSFTNRAWYAWLKVLVTSVPAEDTEIEREGGAQPEGLSGVVSYLSLAQGVHLNTQYWKGHSDKQFGLS